MGIDQIKEGESLKWVKIFIEFFSTFLKIKTKSGC